MKRRVNACLDSIRGINFNGGIMHNLEKDREVASGFSLLELIVTIAIVGIIISIAIPAFSSWLPEYRLKSAVRDLYSNMQLAKLTAVRSNTKCRIRYSKSPDQYSIEALDKAIFLEDYGSGIRFEGPNGESFAVSTITFNARGLSNAGYAYLSNSSNSSYYRISPLTSGVVRLQKWNGVSWE